MVANTYCTLPSPPSVTICSPPGKASIYYIRGRGRKEDDLFSTRSHFLNVLMDGGEGGTEHGRQISYLEVSWLDNVLLCTCVLEGK